MKTLKAFHIFALITSILELNNNLNNLLVPTTIISIIGIFGSVLFFTKNYNFNYLMIIWICSQFIYLKFDNFPMDFSQFFHFNIKFRVGPISIGGNIQILMFIFIKPIMLTKYLNKKISIKPYTANSPLRKDENITFTSNDIKSNKIIGDLNYELDDLQYDNIIFEPLESDKIKKAGVVIKSKKHSKKIKATVTYDYGK
jgi:hypothetical protein